MMVLKLELQRREYLVNVKITVLLLWLSTLYIWKDCYFISKSVLHEYRDSCECNWSYSILFQGELNTKSDFSEYICDIEL